jgi:hypothetical protein
MYVGGRAAARQEEHETDVVELRECHQRVMYGASDSIRAPCKDYY